MHPLEKALEDNMDIRRLDGVGEKEAARFDKYLKAWRWLKEAKPDGN